MVGEDLPIALASTPVVTEQHEGDIGPQLAQVTTVGDDFGTALEPPPVVTGRPDVFAHPGRAEDALIVGDWLLHPTTTAGFAYDSNVSQTPSPQGSPGLRLDSSLLAENDNGIWQTKLYYNSDLLYYLRQIPNYGTILSGRAGVAETYSPLEDLTINAQLDVMRQQDQFNSLGTEQSVITLNPTGVGIAPSANPQSYNQVSGNLSVTKNFSRAFATVGGSIVDIIYDSSSGGISSSPSGVTYTGTMKGGFWLTPMIYGFLAGSLDDRSYQISIFNSSGYRFLLGAGTDRLGLFKGEVYVGYQAENYSSGVPGVASPVYGVHGYYYPLPELTINLSVDETLGVSTEAPIGAIPGTSTKIASYLLSAQYALAPEWSATGRAGYITTDYVGTSRIDGAWTVGATFTYNILQNVGLTLDYQRVQLSSNVSDAGFRRDIATVGATWRY